MNARNRILSFLIHTHPTPMSGATISNICNVGSWRLYLILFRLESENLIVSYFDPTSFGRPRRRLYAVRSWPESALTSPEGREGK